MLSHWKCKRTTVGGRTSSKWFWVWLTERIHWCSPGYTPVYGVYFLFSQHCIYALLNPPWCAPKTIIISITIDAWSILMENTVILWSLFCCRKRRITHQYFSEHYYSTKENPVLSVTDGSRINIGNMSCREGDGRWWAINIKLSWRERVAQCTVINAWEVFLLPGEKVSRVFHCNSIYSTNTLCSA